jgi:hypothetical protein
LHSINTDEQAKTFLQFCTCLLRFAFLTALHQKCLNLAFCTKGIKKAEARASGLGGIECKMQSAKCKMKKLISVLHFAF